MSSGYRILTDDQAEHFLENGFVLLHDCFTADAAAEYTETMWTRLGFDPDDPSTWAETSVHMPSHRKIDVTQFAPKVWDAACDLLDRLHLRGTGPCVGDGTDGRRTTALPGPG